MFAAVDNKVRDHDHVTGKYRGSTHSSCNINLKLTKKVLVIFHNLKGYHNHLIMQEKYKVFKINEILVFIDSMKFMNSSLDTLVKNLSDNDFKYLSQEFTGEQSNLIKQKGVYMYIYECMDIFEKFFEDKLPDRRKFFSSLKDKYISKKDYLHAINVWNTLERKSNG